MCNKNIININNLSKISELFPEGQEVAEETAYKTVDKTEIVTIVSYMIGVRDEALDKRFGGECGEILIRLRKDRGATVIRYLNRLRTRLMQNFKNTDNEIIYNLKNIDRMEWFDQDDIKNLMKLGIPVIQINCRAEKYSEHFCKLINDNIDSCRELFPEWLSFDYIKDLFVIPKYNKPGVLKEEFSKYQKHINEYPFQMYIHWNPDGCGNILLSDGKFINTIYAQHGKKFIDSSKYRDAIEDTKESIYDFIQQSNRVVIVVDCENSDVYKLYGVIKNLNADELSKIEKIILYDDCHTSCGWDWLEKFISIPVEHVEVERVKNEKSLVDIKMTAGVCQAYYKENIDSFILCSSDSDYWGLISSIPSASFLIMYEYSKCSRAIKDALNTRDIYYCSIDDFYTGNAGELKKKVLINELKKMSHEIVGRNARELTRSIYERTRVTAKEEEMEMFYDKYVKTMRLKIDTEGNFKIDVVE